jgi:ribonuclease P/MRP protein subunit POP5
LRCKGIIKEGNRKRYIGFVLTNYSNSNIEKRELVSEIKRQSINLFQKEPKDLGIMLLRFDNERGILRCKHNHKEDAIKLLISINEVSNNKVKIKTIGTSGTIKKLIKKHM